MDRIDKKILAELQLNGRLSFTELADRVGLSLSPCHRRVRALEESGAIKGYKAILDRSVIGLGFSAIVFVTIKEGDKKAVEEFENAIIGIPQIVQAQRLFGDPDFLLYVVADDLPAYQRFYDEKLTAIPSVLRLISTIVMKDVVPERPFPFT
ncbi:Lrp/AsnC family transcriptional regulator [uncultured Psychromonas sp.]|uniref:Lrp/AsnC family transcriptional regulator n=1 Tax=uncultured Psychromonas sp. TaxID=173974 RepID=UPI00260B9098|nr:Lrp/AsnC family transcriptional regulator [uncultured Psychromonas sp.]